MRGDRDRIPNRERRWWEEPNALRDLGATNGVREHEGHGPGGARPWLDVVLRALERRDLEVTVGREGPSPTAAGSDRRQLRRDDQLPLAGARKRRARREHH